MHVNTNVVDLVGGVVGKMKIYEIHTIKLRKICIGPPPPAITIMDPRMNLVVLLYRFDHITLAL